MSARRRILPVFVPHLGCPNDCVFCNQRRISGALQSVSAEDVCRALEAVEGKDEQYELAFYGGSFTAIPSRQQEALLGAALPFLRSGLLCGIRLSTRPDAIDDEVLDRLERFGVTTVELGAQSMADSVLARCRRGHTAEDTRRAAALIRGRGFSLVLQMMTGLPGSSKEMDVDTARQLIALRPDGVRIYPTVIIADTMLADLWRQGAYAEHTVESAVDTCAEILPLFADAGIPIIRLGLNPTEELSGGAALGGAYHPALGELVYSRLRRNEAEALLRGVTPGETVTLGIRRGLLSQLVGQHGANRRWLKETFSLRDVKMLPLDAEDDRIRLLSSYVSGEI